MYKSYAFAILGNPCTITCRVPVYGYTLQPKPYYDDGTECSDVGKETDTQGAQRCVEGSCLVGS